MQLQLKMSKTAEIRYLEANKNQSMYWLTYLNVFKLEQG